MDDNALGASASNPNGEYISYTSAGQDTGGSIGDWFSNTFAGYDVGAAQDQRMKDIELYNNEVSAQRAYNRSVQFESDSLKAKYDAYKALGLNPALMMANNNGSTGSISSGSYSGASASSKKSNNHIAGDTLKSLGNIATTALLVAKIISFFA